MCLVSLNRAVVRIDTCELDIFAEVVSTFLAKEAFTTGDTGFDSYTITWNLIRIDNKLSCMLLAHQVSGF
jgi:hypothetical protein